MVLRLDPHLPVVWRSPTSIQFGISRPVVVMNDVTTAIEHMVAALAAGVTEGGIAMIGQSSGASPDEVSDFRAAIEPALLARDERKARRVLIVGSGATSQRLVQVLASAGFDVWLASDVAAAEAQQCDFAVVVAHFVIDPSLHGIWLRRDVPHLGIVLSDTSVSIGPLVEPGRGACLYCLQFYATEADPAWPAIASQLWGRRSPADTELVASECAASAARMVIDWFAGSSAAVPTAVQASVQERMDVASGRVTRAEFAPHPTCGCLEAGVANGLSTVPAPQENDWASAVPVAPGPTTLTAPTRG